MLFNLQIESDPDWLPDGEQGHSNRNIAPFHRTAVELVKNGISSRAAAALVNAVILDINDIQPLDYCKDLMVDRHKMDR